MAARPVTPVLSAGLEAHLVLRRGTDFRLDLPLTVAPGRTVALLGPNGAGKSTAVAALGGLLALEEGRIALDGALIDEPASRTFVRPEARRIGIVFQDYLLFAHLTVRDNVEFGLRSRGIGRSEARERCASWLERLDLGPLAERRPSTLSGGEAQRVALARALATEPKLLLLDEPLAALDVSSRVELRRVLAEHLAAFDGPRLLITHDPTDAFLLADEICILEDGRLTQRGTGDEIRRHPRTRYVADLGGSNLLRGHAAGGTVTVGDHRLLVAEAPDGGPVLAVIAASAIAVHLHRPEGSPRNAWETVVTRVERLGDRVRLEVGAPLALTVEVTDAAATELALDPGRPVWVSVKATEISVQPR